MSASRPSLAPPMPLGVAVLDAAGAIVAADAGFERLAGNPGPALLGKPFFLEFDAAEAIRAHAPAYLESAGSLDADFTVPEFGAARGELRVRLLSFGAGGGRHAVVLVEDLTELDRLRAVEAAYDLALETASHVRHEINNSLMGILGHLEILLAQAGTPEAIRKRAETLLREVEKIRDGAAALQTIRRE